MNTTIIQSDAKPFLSYETSAQTQHTKEESSLTQKIDAMAPETIKKGLSTQTHACNIGDSGERLAHLKLNKLSKISSSMKHYFDSDEIVVHYEITNIYELNQELQFRSLDYTWRVQWLGYPKAIKKEGEDTACLCLEISNPHLLEKECGSYNMQLKINSIQQDGNEKCFYEKAVTFDSQHANRHVLITFLDIVAQTPNFFSPEAGYLQGDAMQLKVDIKLIK